MSYGIQGGDAVKRNPYRVFLAGLPEEDREDGLDLLLGLRSWLGFAGSLLGTGSTVMARAARNKRSFDTAQ